MISCPKPDWLIELGLRAGLCAEDIDMMSVKELEEWVKGAQNSRRQRQSDKETEVKES